MAGTDLRLGLIGCGNMGNYYAHQLAKSRGASLVVCCDPSPAKLARFREKWNIPGGTVEWRDLFSGSGEGADLDGIINCTLDRLHGPIFAAAAEKGIPFFSEKPLAVDFDILRRHEPETLLSLPFMINFSKRTIPAVEAVRRLVTEGGLGRLHRLELHYRQGWVINHDFGDWRTTSPWLWRLSAKDSYLGVLGDLGSHMIDLAVLLAGPVRSVTCQLNRIDKGLTSWQGHTLDSPDEAFCLLEAESGASLLINLTRTFAGEKDGTEILAGGEKGSIRFRPDQEKDGFQLFRPGDSGWQRVGCPEKPLRNHERFLHFLKNRSEIPSPGITDAVVNHVILAAAAESAERGIRIDLNSFGEEKLGRLWKRMAEQA